MSDSEKIENIKEYLKQIEDNIDNMSAVGIYMAIELLVGL